MSDCWTPGIRRRRSRLKRRVVAGLTAVLIGLAGVSVASAKVAPDQTWETVSTRHFRIHYPPTYRRFTAYLAAYLEDAYEVLSKRLSWELAGPLEVVVRGDTDVANGQASVFPFNRLVVHAVPFSPTSSIGEYDNWIRTLAFHELTHVIANDITRGAFSVGRTIFGSVAKMNSYQPLWLIEGLAVYEETALGIFGRGRSAFADMVIRTASREGLLDSTDTGLGVTLDRLNGGVPEWPHGVTPYLYGYVMNRMIAEKGGPLGPAKVASASGGYLPFFVNTVAKDVLGVDYYDLWDQAVQRMNAVSTSDLERIRREPVTAPKVLARSGRLSRGPTLTPAGDVAYFIRDSYTEGLGISSWERGSGETRVITRWERDGGSSLRLAPRHADRPGGLLYSRLEPHKEFYLHSDVFLFDLEEEEEIRLTHGARATDPDFSPDFAWGVSGILKGSVVYVKNLNDGNQAIARWDGTEEAILFRTQRFERLATPVWGRGRSREWVVFSYKVNGGNERLMAVSVKSRMTRMLTRHAGPSLRVSEVTPFWQMDGGLLYASTLGGVLNLYRIEAAQLDRAFAEEGVLAIPSRITNFETGAMFPVVSQGQPDRLLAMAYEASGFSLAEIPTSKGLANPASLDSLHSKLSPDTIAAEKPDPERYWVDWPRPREEHSEGDPDGYSAFPALWPKFWLPFFEKVTDGITLGAQTQGQDALERHRYTLNVAWDNRATFPVYRVLYQYDGLYPTIQIESRQDNQYIGLLKLSNALSTNAMRFHYPIGNYQVGFGATVSSWRFFNESNSSGGLQFRFSHMDFLTLPNALDPGGDRGRRADLSLSGYFLGGTQFSTLELRYEQRAPSLWDRHFFRLVGSAGANFDATGQAPPFVGGGQESVVGSQGFLVRGYSPGALYGARLATFNAEYWMPLKDIYRARGTLPLFYERAKLRFLIDTGSAIMVGGRRSQFTRWPLGTGVEVLSDITLAYHFRVTLALGFHLGLDEKLGGERQVVVGLYSRGL
ncbi:MAG: hypothetical protein IT285_09040 [Bdellovibrionales bacterium]|nr:hypothetical protein [Bdellovibrionales bacterium]